MNTIPVTILTGFLGSGKTTLLNRLLRRPALRGAVVIVNEFGEVGLDHLLIEASEERFALLDNGCVCCTVRGDLADTLKEIARRSDAGTSPPVSSVLVETTGLADPAPILHTLIAEPELAARYHVGSVVTTVDAVNGPATLERHPEAAKQAAVADRLLVTKSDLVTEADLARLEARLRELSPAAAIAIVSHGEAGALELPGGAGSDAARVAELTASLARAEAAGRLARDQACGPACGHDHVHGHGGRGHAHHGIESYSFVIDRPIEWPAFAQWLDYVAMLKGEDMLRMKGIVNVAGEPDRPLVVHGVQHVFHPPARLAAWPSSDRRSRIVFIVRNIPRELLERTLSRFARIEARPPDNAAERFVA